MKWGDKHPNGCKQPRCTKLHPELCVRSLALECLDRKCPAKLHTKRCRRAAYSATHHKTNQLGGSGHPQNRGGQRQQLRGGIGQQFAGRSGQGQQYADRAGQGQQHASRAGQGQQQHRDQPRKAGHSDSDGHSTTARCDSQAWQSQINQGFPNLTVQPQLEAIIQAMMKQQQELTRIALKELTPQFGKCGARGSCHSHSSC